MVDLKKLSMNSLYGQVFSLSILIPYLLMCCAVFLPYPVLSATRSEVFSFQCDSRPFVCRFLLRSPVRSNSRNVFRYYLVWFYPPLVFINNGRQVFRLNMSVVEVTNFDTSKIVRMFEWHVFIYYLSSIQVAS